MKNIPIGEVLKEMGYLSEEQLNSALAYQKEHRDSGKRLGTVLIEQGYVTELQMLTALGQKMNLQMQNMDDYPVDVEAVKKIPRQMAEKYCALAISNQGNRLTVVMNDPLNFYGIEDIRLVTGMPVVVTLAEKAKIQQAIDVHYSEIEAKQVAKTANQSLGTDDSLERLGDAAAQEMEAGDDQTPVIKLLNSLLTRGYTTNASDIHIEPFETETKVRMRIDGMLLDYLTLAHNLHQPLVARTKIMSNLDIAEKRMPQDGHFKTRLDGVEMNLRVSTIPTVYGEKVVLRYLNSAAKVSNENHFGMNDANYRRFAGMLGNPHGVIYITGPTGSGKTTTLYMALEQLSQRQVNISTIEDPVERNLARINQVQVNTMAGLTFEVGLRSLLRQDPDIIMVGETRDAETAEISIRSAITGHLVVSTLHTNDAISSIVRLEDMGIEPYMVANSIVGLVAQRLVRKICPYCKEEYTPDEEESLAMHGQAERLWRGRGCPACNNTGYKGRTAVHEVVSIDGAIKRMIAEQHPIEEIYDYAREKQNFKTLLEGAEELVLQGVTTVEELLKLAYYMD